MSFLNALFPISREACGAVVFKLAPETIQALEQQEIEFLNTALQGRGYPDQGYYRYSNWHRTPTPSQWWGDGVVAASLTCAGIDRWLFRRIVEAGARAGGYYSTKPEAQLIVLPQEGVAILAYYG